MERPDANENGVIKSGEQGGGEGGDDDQGVIRGGAQADADVFPVDQ